MKALVSEQRIERATAQSVIGLVCLFRGIPVPEIKLVEPKVTKDGVIAGEYTRKNGRIHLSREIGMTKETVMHELAHHFVMTVIPEVTAHGNDFFDAEEQVWSTYESAVDWWNNETKRERK